MCNRFQLTAMLAMTILLLGIIGCGKDSQPTTPHPDETFISSSVERLDFGVTTNLLTVSIKNNNNPLARWTAKTDARWIAIYPKEGAIEAWGERKITVNVHRSRMSKWRELDMILIDIPKYEEQKEIIVTAEEPKLHPSHELLTTLIKSFKEEDIEKYLSIFWEDEYLFRTTFNNNNFGELHNLDEDKLWTQSMFNWYEDIRLEFPLPPDIRPKEGETIVRARYRIQGTEVNPAKPDVRKVYASEGDAVFTFEERGKQWRIREWEVRQDKPGQAWLMRGF